MGDEKVRELAKQLAAEAVFISQKYAHEKKNAATKRQGEVRAVVSKFTELVKNEEV